MLAAPVARRAARVILVDQDGRTLLLCGEDPHRPEDGRWWITPGGGLDPGESHEQAARREVFEETGYVVIDLGPVVFEREVEFFFENQHYRQSEKFYRVLVDAQPLNDAGWTDVERRSVLDHRWWTVDELRETPETVYPAELPELL